VWNGTSDHNLRKGRSRSVSVVSRRGHERDCKPDRCRKDLNGKRTANRFERIHRKILLKDLKFLLDIDEKSNFVDLLYAHYLLYWSLFLELRFQQNYFQICIQQNFPSARSLSKILSVYVSGILRINLRDLQQFLTWKNVWRLANEMDCSILCFFNNRIKLSNLRNWKYFWNMKKIMLYINMWKIRPSLFVDLFPSSDITGCTCIKFEHVVTNSNSNCLILDVLPIY